MISIEPVLKSKNYTSMYSGSEALVRYQLSCLKPAPQRLRIRDSLILPAFIHTRSTFFQSATRNCLLEIQTKRLFLPHTHKKFVYGFVNKRIS